MILAPVPIGKGTFPAGVLENDLKTCVRAGNCGLGRKALYIGGRFLDRHYYIPWTEVRRVFKRVAMSSGGFSGKGIFGSMAFLVVQYGSGFEKECRFKNEGILDALLDKVEKEHPDIPVHSAKAEKKLAEAAAAEEARYLKELSPDAEKAVKKLRREIGFLEGRSSLYTMLAASAKQKRIIDNMSPVFRIGGAVFGVLGILSVLYGLFGLLTRQSFALYFLIGGAAVFFMTLATNTFPSRWNSRKTAVNDWNKALTDMRKYLQEYPDFSVPAQYAHPVVLERMIRIIREGRADNTADALRIMKEDLKALNSSVKVSQKEYDEVVRIKPIFLVCGYQDEI
ncbi:MAG: ATPase P [Lachnospiraceae bacterium]|nr:ATPase P [Lachnospiraceae bacterium]